jgi:hypothetical protein
MVNAFLTILSLDVLNPELNIQIHPCHHLYLVAQKAWVRFFQIIFYKKYSRP